MKISFRINEETPSLNALLRWHFRTRKREELRWGGLINASIRHNMERCGVSYTELMALGRRRLTVQRFGRLKGGLDSDNLRGGLKLVIDSMRRMGLLVDDNDKFFELFASNEQRQPKEPLHTIFTLEDI